MIQGKPLSEKVLERAQMVGFFILIALMIFTLGNDIIKW
jgi:regulator of sigma E protease